MTESSSAFIVPADFSSEWHDITLLHRHTHSRVYAATRYGRRFLLKGLAPEDCNLTDFRLQQEQEFQLGIQLVHPNIAATYGLEEVQGLGRCIVLEWIDGITLGEWLQSKPSKVAREQVFEQILDALEYLHSRQLVHHDLKADNILITRNGTNVKLIDFGLSAFDSTLSPVPNDPQTDIQALGKLFPIRGHYANIVALRRATTRRKRLQKMIPLILSIILLVVAAIFFYFSYQEHHAEQRRQQEMIARVDEAFTKYAAEMQAAVDKTNTYFETVGVVSQLTQKSWLIRDSLIALYPEKDPLRVVIFDYWTQLSSSLHTEILQEAQSKPIQ